MSTYWSLVVLEALRRWRFERLMLVQLVQLMQTRLVQLWEDRLRVVRRVSYVTVAWRWYLKSRVVSVVVILCLQQILARLSFLFRR